MAKTVLDIFIVACGVVAIVFPVLTVIGAHAMGEEVEKVLGEEAEKARGLKARFKHLNSPRG